MMFVENQGNFSFPDGVGRDGFYLRFNHWVVRFPDGTLRTFHPKKFQSSYVE
jgi:hypothetical protein